MAQTVVETQQGVNQIPASVKRNFSTIVVPFVFDKEFKDAVNTIQLSEKWASQKNKNRQKLYEHIHQLAVEEEQDVASGTIGRIFTLTELGYVGSGLPQNIKSKPFIISKKNQKYRFTLCETNLYLFETNIGFLVYEVEYPKNIDIDTYIETNNLLKNIKPQRGVTWEIYTGEQTPSIETNLSQITESILREFNVSSYFESEKKVPQHALLFNSVVIDFGQAFDTNKQGCKEKLKQYLFELRRVFRSSYQPSPAEFNIEQNDEILQTFENSYWGVSLEGVANIAYLMNNNNTDSFFLSNYIQNIKSTYFYIYMISLHQRYALLNLSIKASNLLITNHSEPNEMESPITVRGLRKEIILFTLRSSFKHVSTVTHHGKVYQIINNSLQIDELNKELHFELEILDSMIETEREEERRRQEKQQIDGEKQTQKNREKFQDKILILSNFFVVISTLSATWSLLYPIFGGKYPAAWSAGFYVLIGLFVLVLFCGYFGTAQIVKKIKELEKQNVNQ